MSTATATTSTTTRFSADRKALLAAYTAASSVSPPRSPKPILQSVKLSISHAGAEIIGTDLEVGIRAEVAGVASDTPVQVVLPRKFGEILSTSKDEQIHVSIGEDYQVDVSGLRSKFKLLTEDPNLFPDVPEAPGDLAHFAVTAGDLRTLINRTQYATDPESTRYALGGTLVELDLAENTISFVGTDGRRLARQQARMEAVPDGNGDQPATTFTTQPVIPLKALKLITRTLADCEAEAIIHLYINSNRVIVRTETATIYTRLVEGRYPKYQDVFPDSVKSTAIITAGELKLTCQQALIMTGEESRAVDFAFAEDSLTLSSQSADAGTSTIETAIRLEGPPLTIALDPKYLLDALATIRGDEEVKVELVDGKHAVVLRVDGGFAYVVSPLTRER